jgi:hypothetical protein
MSTKAEAIEQLSATIASLAAMVDRMSGAADRLTAAADRLEAAIARQDTAPGHLDEMADQLTEAVLTEIKRDLGKLVAFAETTATCVTALARPAMMGRPSQRAARAREPDEPRTAGMQVVSHGATEPSMVDRTVVVDSPVNRHRGGKPQANPAGTHDFWLPNSIPAPLAFHSQYA